MRPVKPSRLSRLLLLGLLALAANVRAAGLFTPADGSLPPLEIRDHRVDVIIEDSYAITTVEQVFHNPHDHDLEATYSFPVPAHGTVAEFTLWIDGQPVTGEVLEKAQARTVYEQERQAGRDAGLAEKDAYRTFDIHVHPVRAGQDTRIRLVYLQPAGWTVGSPCSTAAAPASAMAVARWTHGRSLAADRLRAGALLVLIRLWWRKAATGAQTRHAGYRAGPR